MRHARALLIAILIIGSVGCDSFYFSSNTQSFSGTVSVVRLSVTGDGTQTTFVTLIGTSGAQDYNFCGNLVNQFPLSTSVQGTFTPGPSCGAVVSVHIVG